VQSIPHFLCIFGSFLRYQAANFEREPYRFLHDSSTTNRLQFDAEQKGTYLKMDSSSLHHKYCMLILLYELSQQHFSDGA
jgi:hypothetical protein